MAQRRYDDDEVAEILARATEGQEVRPAEAERAREGLTLEQLQEIGSEVGIAPARIAEAASILERRANAPAPRTFLGAPRSVARSVPLPRSLTREEWEGLVAELRSTFGAVGKVTAHGSLRTWNNGNLQAHVEPDGRGGWRLRMQTLKGDASAFGGTGGVFTLVGLLLLVLGMMGRGDAGGLVIGLVFMLVGLGQLGYVRLSLPGWAEERAAQMEAIADRLPGLLEP